MNLREAAQMALEALEQFSEISDFTPAMAVHAITALRAALAEPQTTHWEGCEEVHPECRKPEPLAAWENKYGMKEWQVHAIRAGWMPAPTPRKPLTDEEIILIVAECASSHQHTDIHFARAIERAHGIGEQT